MQEPMVTWKNKQDLQKMEFPMFNIKDAVQEASCRAPDNEFLEGERFLCVRMHTNSHKISMTVNI